MQGLFNMTSDSGLFFTREKLEAEGYTLNGNVFERGESSKLPLYEAKMMHQYDAHWATYDLDGSVHNVTLANRMDPSLVVLPRYWVAEESVNHRLTHSPQQTWLLGWRDVTRSTDSRTVISAILPKVGVGDKLLLASVPVGGPLLLASWSSLVHDYVARQKLGGTSLKYFTFSQLPALPLSTYRSPTPWRSDLRLDDWIEARVEELTFTSWDLKAFAAAVGDDGPPFIWDDGRRESMRVELDAAYCHLYGLQRDEVEYVLATFPIVQRKDEAKFGEYRTARHILEVYDAMAQAMATRVPHRTLIDPPPGEGPRHPYREGVA